MFRILRKPRLCSHVRLASTGARFRPVKSSAPSEAENVADFDPSEPVLFRKRFTALPAIERWFTPMADNEGFHELKLPYLEPYGSTMVPLELSHTRAKSSSEEGSAFERFEAPLSILLSQMTSTDEIIALYLAQCSLPDLPPELQADLPTPSLVSHIGRGDIYASSLWMGRPPTTTPLHRDPNPNLFIQLAGRKTIRLMKPDDGKRLYESIRVGRGHANMRGDEMMAGEEKTRLERAVWNDETADNVESGGVEANLESGDALYMPLGWWHAVHGFGRGANASVNWWFR